MEKLILRGVMWGADKIPDPWFDKLPGGYYKAKEEQHKKQKRVEMKKRRSRRHSDDEYDEEDSRPGQDDGYRSEGHGRHGDLGKSHDGVDHFDDINNRPRRRRSNPRRHRDDDTRYGHADGYGGRDRRNGAEGVEYGSGVLPLDQRAHPIPPGADPYVAGAAAAAGAAGVQAAQGGMGSPFSDPRSPQQPPSSNHSGGTHPAMASTSTLRGGMATGYVPYAHIYGGPTQPIGQSGFAPSPSDTGSIQPNFLNQVAAPVMPQQNYQQNPYAQEAPLGSQPGYMPDPYWNERQYQDQPSEHRGSRDRRRKDDYESSEESYSPPRRRRSRRSRRDRSSSRDRYSEEDSRRNRRARSERPANGTPVPARGQNPVRSPVFVNPHHSLAHQMAHPAHPPPPPSSYAPPYSRKKEEMRTQARNGYRSD